VAAVASIWAIGTAAMAAGYATRPGQRLDRIAVPAAVVLVGWLAIGCATTVGLVLAGQRQPDPAFTWVDVATVPVQVYVLVVLALVALGVIADVRAAAIRADERLTAAVDPGSRQQRLWALAVATARELVPGQATADAAIHDAERTRLAGDLHAVVLPSLRRAIAAAEADGDPETVASHLRTVDLELERLMADRWPVVLEALGLVRALEDLAERLEADGAPAIQIEVVGPGGRPPVAVERAAWRCGQVALDNAIRHGRPTAISVSVATAPSALQLTVADDGRGYVETTGGSVPRGRGIADARQRAADVGATVRLGPGTDGGTVVTFDWSTPTGH
jgi:signal transduction histidine kinase